MGDFIQNFYVYLWGILAVLTFIVALKSRKGTKAMAFGMVFFFVFMTVWYGLRTFGGYAMFDGTLGIVFKIILGVFLAILLVTYFVSKKSSRNK